MKPCEAPGEEKGIKMASKLLPWVLQEVLFRHLCRKRRTFTKHCYLLCKTHIGKVLGALFYDLFLDNCRLGAYKNPHLQKNSKNCVSGRPWERQGAPMVSQSDTKWIQNGTPNALKIHPLSQCRPRGGPNVTFRCLGVPPLVQKRCLF